MTEENYPVLIGKGRNVVAAPSEPLSDAVLDAIRERVEQTPTGKVLSTLLPDDADPGDQQPPAPIDPAITAAVETLRAAGYHVSTPDDAEDSEGGSHD